MLRCGWKVVSRIFIALALVAGGVVVTGTPASASETADWLPVKSPNGVAEIGATWDPNGLGLPNHTSANKGIDFIVPIGTAIYAAGAGTVAAVNGSCTSCDTRGRFVEISHADGRKSRYLHLSSATVNVGQVVSRGQHIGNSGDTMANNVPHLHYDEVVGGSKVDPGPMNAMHGNTLVQYPNDLGYSAWNDVPAWGDKFVWNDSYTQSSPPGLAVQLVHHWQSGSGATDAVKVTPSGVTGGDTTTIGAVSPGDGQFGLGDFNSDGVQDLYLVVTQGDPSGKSVVFVAAGPSYASFLAAVQTPMGQFDANHGDVVIGDFNGDNKADVGVLFANNGASNAAFGVLNAATTFQSWSYLANIPIGGHDGSRSDAVAGDFNHDQVLDLGVGFHQGTPTNNVDFFQLNGASSYQSVSGYSLPLGGWQNGQGQLLSGRFGTSNDQLGVVYTANTPSGKPDLFVLNGMSTVSGSWTLDVGIVPANQRMFIGM